MVPAGRRRGVQADWNFPRFQPRFAGGGTGRVGYSRNGGAGISGIYYQYVDGAGEPFGSDRGKVENAVKIFNRKTQRAQRRLMFSWRSWRAWRLKSFLFLTVQRSFAR